MHESKRFTIVLVDDTVEIRYLLRILLANVTLCTVAGEAEDGERAVELAERLQPDIVVLDVRMPVLDGLEALPRIKAASPATSVIVYSSDPNARDEALRRGAFRYVEKGRDPQEVVRAVREAIGVS